MKKYLFLFMTLALVAFTGCDDHDTDPGGTAVEEMAGEWDVEIIALDNTGKQLGSLGTTTFRTYNTASNTSSQMWLDDNNSFWPFKFLVDVDYNTKTFSATSRESNDGEKGTVVVENGKVLKNAAKNLHGMPNDSIVFTMHFSDDPQGYGASDYLITGQRYTGFTR